MCVTLCVQCAAVAQLQVKAMNLYCDEKTTLKYDSPHGSSTLQPHPRLQQTTAGLSLASQGWLAGHPDRRIVCTSTVQRRQILGQHSHTC